MTDSFMGTTAGPLLCLLHLENWSSTSTSLITNPHVTLRIPSLSTTPAQSLLQHYYGLHDVLTAWASASLRYFLKVSALMP